MTNGGSNAKEYPMRRLMIMVAPGPVKSKVIYHGIHTVRVSAIGNQLHFNCNDFGYVVTFDGEQRTAKAYDAVTLTHVKEVVKMFCGGVYDVDVFQSL